MNGQFFGKVLWGLILIGVGVLFLLNQLGIVNHFDYGYIFSTYWPVFIIYLGLWGVIGSGRYGWWRGGAFVWNAFVMLLGVFFLLRNLNIEGFTYANFSKFIFPVVIILLGLSVLFHGGRPNDDKIERRMERRMERIRRRRDKHNWHWDGGNYGSGGHGGHGGHGANGTGGFGGHAGTGENKGSTGFGGTGDIGGADGMSGSGSPDDPGKIDEAASINPFFPGAGGPSSAPQGEPSLPPLKTGHNHWEGNPFDEWQGRQHRHSFIGDVHLGQDYWELQPLSISHFIGDTVIDLTKASIPYGETKIDVSAFIGDTKVYVPNDMMVEIKVSTSAFISDMNILDRHEGGIFRNMTVESPYYRDAEKKIRLSVSTFIGDVIVKRVG